jgi:hypothetical protein
MLSFYDMQKANQFMAAPADTLDLASHIAKFYGGNGRLSGAVSRWQLKMPDDLLRAAALPGAEGTAAYRRSVDAIDMADSRHQQLVPAILKNIGADAMADKMARQSRIFCLQNLANNQALLKELQQHLKLLYTAEIPVLCIKGVALLHTLYPDISVRRAADSDIVVPEQQFNEALSLLANQGWVEPGLGKLVGNALDTRFVSGIGLVHPDYRFPLDIHCHMNHGVQWVGADELFWSRAVESQVGSQPTLILCPEDNFTQLLIHGLSANDAPPIRWVLDALLTLRSAASFDWQIVIANAQRMDMVPQHYSAISYLLTLEEHPGMREAATQLESLPVTADGLTYWSFRLERPETIWEAIQQHRIHFSISAAGRGLAGKPWRVIPAYLRNWARVENLALGIGIVLGKILKRIATLGKGSQT